ncbi:uncharacterized protein LOC111778349 isoform X1 [Cucurbita pepo subsp. pepo]|uniref:uncharacterized protein LOC111778349 isoform X1 n=2 Tax=Cucurbita pepo subsp. pepo TaxID=3664 RepID=UPI000C9D4779|nr:uncharacterized protein LOC111778349 isoform X1 [Cucurbita pepo subsp. pepo]XP_023513889.1 uncharacterized protein LOC111778349 isoform X1 [Cucurbita pepo subsp. pepo]
MVYLAFKMAGVKRRIHNDSDILAMHKELDEVSCPICIDHPHNAVLLLCSSHHKGCKPYICDTSHRHSNCFDQFKKLREETRKSPRLSSPLPMNPYSFSSPPTNNLGLSIDLNEVDENQNINERNTAASPGLSVVVLGDNGTENSNRTLDTTEGGDLDTAGSGFLTQRAEQEGLDAGNSSEYSNLKCPMCRGAVLGWEVIEEAREYLNLKKRSCSRETCSFSGNYQELRRHARRVHPTSRPSVTDPSRERAWRRLERQREVGDVVSAIRSAMPGALVVGDYVIENGDGMVAGERDNGTRDVNGPLLTSFFLFHMFGSVDGGAREPRPRSRSSWVRRRRSGGGMIVPERQFLWGENLLGMQEDADEDFRIYIGMGDDASPPTRRRRVTRPGSDADQP